VGSDRRNPANGDRSGDLEDDPDRGTGQRRLRQRLERRNQLLDAAIDAIRALGPAATMEQLAAQGGVTKPILYRHFVDRDGLIAAIAERFADGLLMSVSGPLVAVSDPRELLDTTIDAYVAFLERDPNLYGFLVQQSSPRTDHRSSLGSLVDVVAKQIAQVTGERLQAAGRDSGAAVPWAYGIVGLVHQSTHWWLRDQSMSRERFVRYLTDLLWHGLSGGPAGSQPAAGARTARSA